VLLRSNETYTLMVGLQIFAARSSRSGGGCLQRARDGCVADHDHLPRSAGSDVGGLTQGAVKG